MSYTPAFSHRPLVSLLFLAILFFFSCETHLDKGREYQIDESEITTPYKNLEYERDASCRECHTAIYDEFENSMHRNATVFKDPIHRAVWEQHPNFKNKKQYTCAQCHIPAADNIEDFMEKEGQAFPDENNITQNEAVSCGACHRIKSIEKHRFANRNIYKESKITYYGISSGTSPSHDVNDDNKLYFNSKVCMGCHSHRENVNGYVVCITDEKLAGSFETCVSCHMPQVPGTGSSTKMASKHFYHGFAGAHNNQEMLTKFVLYSAKKIADGEVELHIENKAPHDLFLHPLRKSIIQMRVIRDGKSIHEFDPILMERVLEDGKGVAGCTNAIKETKSNIILGGETRVVNLKYAFAPKDKLEVEYGYHLVKQPFDKILKLEENKDATKYKLYKKELVTID